MSHAKFSPEGRLIEFIHEERSTASFIASLAKLRGVPRLTQSRLNEVERGVPLNHDDASNLDALMRELEHLRDAVKPIPVRYWNALDVNELLNLIREGKLFVVIAVTPDEKTHE